MALPYTDPALISAPSPYFQDNSFVRGDQMRGNNQAIWGDMEYLNTTKALLEGAESQGFAAKYLDLGGNCFIYQDADGSLFLVSNAYTTDAGITIKLFTTGKRARRLRLEGSDGKGYFDYSQIGTAGDTASWTTSLLVNPGEIQGSLEFQSSSLPATVKSGVREFNGISHHLAADYNLTMSDVIGSCSQTIANYAYQWIFILIDLNGLPKWSPGFDNWGGVVWSLSGIAVTSVVVTGGNSARCYTANTVGLIVADGHNAVVIGSDAGLISGQITGLSANTYFDVACTKTNGTYSAGTYSAYYRVQTMNGVGTQTNIIADASVGVFDVSPQFCPELQIRGLDVNGIPTSIAANVYYRILGHQYVGSAGAVSNRLRSYKSGDAQDATNISWQNTTTTHVLGAIRFSTSLLNECHGQDLLFTDDGTSGTKLTANTPLSIHITLFRSSNNNGRQFTIYTSGLPGTVSHQLVANLWREYSYESILYKDEYIQITVDGEFSAAGLRVTARRI